MKQTILEYLFKQGPTLTILALVAYLFYIKTKELETKIDNCQGQQIELLKTTVQDNTRAWLEFSQTMKEQRKK